MTLQVKTPSDREIVMVHAFAAPRDTVFAALTDAERVIEWLRPAAMALVAYEVDLRAGGRLRYVFERPNGRRIEVRGTFGVVEPPRRFAYTESYDFSPLEVEVTTSLEEAAGQTIVTQALRYASRDERDEDLPGVTEAAAEAFANLDRHLANRSR